MNHTKNILGFTLVEVLIYIALFSIIIGGGMVSVFTIIQNSSKNQAQVILQEEINFILSKLNWIIVGAGAITSPVIGSNGTNLIVTKSTGNIEMRLNGNTIQTKEGVGSFFDVNNTNVRIESLTFQHNASINGKPESISITIIVTDNYGHTQTISQTKYLRR